MGLFLISFVFTVLIGFFTTSIFEQKNFIKIFIYFCTTMFASVVLNVEILSLLNSISQTGILALNTLFSIISGVIWYKKGKPIFKIKYKKFFKRFRYAILSDKYLFVLGLSFLFMIFVSIFIIAIMPVVNFDAEIYHVVRSLFWIGNKNLNHFVIGDIRNLVMPINSEILYLWVFTFLKKELFLGIFSFVGFWLSIVSIYGILNIIGFSERHKLWVIFILSSLPSVITQISATEPDVIIAGLATSSIYLYLEYYKSKRLTNIYFSALAFALAIGTKTPALMLMFPVGLWMLWIGFKNDKNECMKVFLKFLGFGFINFVIFSSYNYILNFLDFGNIFGPKSFLQVHNNLYGIKGAIANFIKHIFLFFDFTGFKLNEVFGTYIIKLKTYILIVLHLNTIPDGYYTSNVNKINYTIFDSLAGMGILGFLVVLPCVIYAIIKPLFTRNNKNIMITSFALIFIGTMFVMSYTIPFMTYNIRFLTDFCIVASPVLVYSYSRKNTIAKFLITVFALFGLILISTHIWRAPVLSIISHLNKGYTISEIRQISKCSGLKKTPRKQYSIDSSTECVLRSIIKSQPQNSNILYFPNHNELLTVVKLLDFYGYNVAYKSLEEINDVNFNLYDVIITRNMMQKSSVIKKSDKESAYSPTTGIKCTYYNEDNSIYLPEKNKMPHQSICKIDEDFFKEHNFVKDNVFNMISTYDKFISYSVWTKKK